MTVTKDDDQSVKERLVALTRDLMLVPTTLSRPEEMARGLQQIKNHLEGLEKVKIRDYEHRGIPSIVAFPDRVKKPDILLCGHIDVIDYPSSSVFTSSIRDGRIYGPGAGDMKGAVAIILEIFRAFHHRRPGLSLGVAITSDEEVGGADGVGYLFGKAGLRCGLALVPDGGTLNRITTHEKGILHLRAVCHGRFSHASRPWEGDNALLRLTRGVVRLEKAFRDWQEPEPHWHPTCSLTMMHTTNEVINRIPDHAECILDVRFPPPFSSRQMLKVIRESLDEDIEIETVIKAEPTDLQPDPLYFEVTEKMTGRKADEIRDHGGSDARFIASCGIPVIIARPDVGNLHTRDEWIDIDSMVTFYRIYEEFIARKLNCPAWDKP